ncbi:MAG: hypothetical protein KF860_03820 [Cyclobacteriaceae bacterium]|nr:hypothetical protein [Cyclobacteriaceae bacterium]
MKTIKYLSLTLVGIFILVVSCKDDRELVPVWETGVTAYAEVADGSEDNFVFGFPAIGVTYDFQWVSADSKSTVTKIDFYVLFDEPYVDGDGNDAIANHGGSTGVYWKSLEGGNVPANRVNTAVTVTQADVYELFKTAKYDYGNGEIDVFGATPQNTDRDVTNRFVTDDAITVKWKLTLSDGRVMGGVAGGEGWSPSACTELPGSNCLLAWSVVDPADSAPKATLSLKSGKNLKAAAKDTVFVSFNKKVANAPALALAATAGGAITGTIGTPALYKTSETKYFAVYEAPAGYTGGVKVTASGSATPGTAPFGGLVMAAKSITVNVDNTAPEGVGNGNIFLAKNGSAVIKMTFNEAMSTVAKDSIYVTISGQNMDAFANKRMTLAADGKSASITYNYKDAGDDATAGPMTVVVAGGKDVAGNALSILNQPALTIDLFTPTGVTVTLPGAYDFGTQIKISSATITNAGSTKGTIYWVAVDAGDPAPVHPYDTDDAVASGSFAASGSAQFINFAPNGNFDLYFYAVTDTGNKSAYTVAPLSITMNP